MCCFSNFFLVCLFTQFSLSTLPFMFTHNSCICLCIVFIGLSMSIYNFCVFMIFFPTHTRFPLMYFFIFAFLHNSWNIMQSSCSCSFMTYFIVHTIFLQAMTMKKNFINFLIFFCNVWKTSITSLYILSFLCKKTTLSF